MNEPDSLNRISYALYMPGLMNKALGRGEGWNVRASARRCVSGTFNSRLIRWEEQESGWRRYVPLETLEKRRHVSVEIFLRRYLY